MRTKEVMNLIKNRSNKLKYAAIIGTALLIAVDANASSWNLSEQLGISIVNPIKEAFKSYASVLLGLAAGGALLLGTQGDLRERSKAAGIGFLGGYGVIEVIKAMSGIV